MPAAIDVPIEQYLQAIRAPETHPLIFSKPPREHPRLFLQEAIALWDDGYEISVRMIGDRRNHDNQHGKAGR